MSKHSSRGNIAGKKTGSPEQGQVSSMPGGRPRLARACRAVLGRWRQVVFGLTLLLFVLQNTARTRFNFVAWDFHAPMWLMLALAGLAGLVGGISRRTQG